MVDVEREKKKVERERGEKNTRGGRKGWREREKERKSEREGDKRRKERKA